MVRPVVHSKKHYVQTSLETVTGGSVTNIAFVVAVSDLPNTVAEVVEGAIIKAVYVEFWARSSSTTPSSGQCIIYKRTGDQSNPTATDMAALGNWDNKKNIFFTQMGLQNDQDTVALPLYKGWIKIPKSKQRFGLGDRIQISIFAATIDWVICGFATYKEYT